MKLIRVNMTDKSIGVEDVPEKYRGLGGRGLTSAIINAEVPPECDPLGPENKLIFAPGLLSGTALVNTSRISIGAKSPLTGGIKESNAGGTTGNALGKLGITALIIEGKAPEGDLSLVSINEKGEASLMPAKDYKAMRTYALVERLLKEHGDKNGILCIGPAGEYQLSLASIQTADVDGRPCRAAGRGGLGAVMGSKGIKAILVSLGGKSPDALADPDTFKDASRVFAKAIRDNPFTGQMLPNLGTAALVSIVNSMGAFPSYNATRGQLDGFEKISGEALAETIKERGGKTTHMGCTQCVAQCSNEFVDSKGTYVTASLEYETIWSMGGMTGISDLDTIARLDFLCDDIGLDTMGTGVAVAVAMDAGHKKFGDGQAAIDMVEEIATGSDFGRIIGNGAVAVGKHFNHARVPVVKGQSIAAYDPRAMQGNGVTYATSPMGGDHTAGNLIGDYLTGRLDPLKPDGQVEASRNTQILMAMIDTIGLCLLVATALQAPEAMESLIRMINAKLGTEYGLNDLMKIGGGALKAEREFNRKAGFTNKDDRLPTFFSEEALPPHNTVFLVTDEELDSTFDF